MNENYKFVRRFISRGPFTAFYDACDWLQTCGYSVGSMCREMPIGIKKGHHSIAKWKNLGEGEITELDGIITSDNFREGDVEIYFKKDV